VRQIPQGTSELSRQEVLVRRLCVESADVRSLELVSADGQALQPFDAGAHVDVHFDNGLVRQYSLINTTDIDGSYRIAIKLEPASRGGSSRMHRISVGDALTVGFPRNNFPLDPAASHTMLLGGGIGITPLLGMARHLTAKGASFALDYFARSRAVLAFGDEIGGGPFAACSRFHLGLNGEATRAELASRLVAAPAGTHVYACGPAPFMQTICDLVAGKPGLILHLEYFAADAALADLPRGSFRVNLTKSGRTIVVGADQTIVEALVAAGIEVATSCEQGVCGTCLTTVLAGRPDHRDMLLTEEEQQAGDRILLCVSGCLDQELVLDL
jgi:vanillate monooxygenase ferredoxin subunit